MYSVNSYLMHPDKTTLNEHFIVYYFIFNYQLCNVILRMARLQGEGGNKGSMLQYGQHIITYLGWQGCGAQKAACCSVATHYYIPGMARLQGERGD